MSNSKDYLNKELDDYCESLNLDELTDEEKKEIIEEAQRSFDELEGVDYEETKNMTSDEIIKSEINTSKQVLKKNINRIEKLTNLIFNQIMLSKNDGLLIQLGISIIQNQNQNLKLLGELEAKMLENKTKLRNLDKDDKNNNKKNKLPPGFSKE